MRAFVLCIASVFALDDDHISVLQQNKVTTDMLDRATRTSSFTAQLDAAVAGKKKSKCNEIEAAELVSCLRIGEVNALDLLSAGESLDSAVESITSRVGEADCKTLRQDMRCMQKNPCYKRAVKALPITFDLDTMENVKVSKLCKDAKSVEILADSKITWGSVCAESPQDLCSVLYGGVEEVRVDYDTCGVTCTGDIADELASIADDARFSTTSHNSNCSTYSSFLSSGWINHMGWTKALPITSKADCEKASTIGLTTQTRPDVWEATTYKFKAIRYQKRPAGCYRSRQTVYWNAVKTGKTRAYRPRDITRYPVCLME